MSDETAELLREVIARPDDDGVRAVLADALQAAGDPRGELISLQLLAARGNRERDDRIQELLAAHGGRWLGALAEVVRASELDRGFARRLELAAAWAEEDERWDVAVGDPVLSTVEDLVPGTVRGDTYRRFVTSTAMGNLRALEVFDRGSLEALEATSAGSHGGLEHVAFARFTSDQEYRRRDAWARGEEAAVLDAAEALDEVVGHRERLWAALQDRPWITSLGLALERLDQVVSYRWFQRLEALVLGTASVQRGLAAWPRLGVRRLTLASSASLEPCDHRYPWDYKVELAREQEGLVARISGEWLLQPLTALAALPHEVRRVEIERTSDVIAARVREVLAWRSVEIVEVPRRANNFVWERPESRPKRKRKRKR